jgi:phosphoribosylamine--glycine ligase / phosphoribosylformylglycinamidine cyclo-ligase
MTPLVRTSLTLLLISGIDLVAMNVNDVLVQGAKPLFLLDYYACGQLNVDEAAAFVKGVADGCIKAGCALIGGETAEMPSLYAGKDFDAAAAAVGAVMPENILPRNNIEAGDVLLGLASSGAHSNGFSLIRKIVEREDLSYTDPAPWDPDLTVGESLLTPTRIYCESFLEAHKQGLIKGASHITGGGFIENIPRMLPDHLAAKVDALTWELPPLFKWMAKSGNVGSDELSRTFNIGIGMVLVVSEGDKSKAKAVFSQYGEQVFEIGEVITKGLNAKRCIIEGTQKWVS